jgi:type I restriction enzyme, S subunit
VLKQAFEGQWRLVSVKDVLLQPPSNGRSVKDRENGFPVLRLTALKGRQVDLAERKNGNWERDEALPFLIREGDFLLSRGNGSKHLVGRGGIVPKHTEEIAYPDTIVRLKINPELMNVKFFCLLWNSRILRDQIEQSARTTAGIYKINQRQINEFKLPITSLEEQHKIVEILERTLSGIDALENEINWNLEASHTLRQSILKKAFSGRLVPQDPNDEPASVLLERIRAEKATQSIKSRTRKRKPSKEVA